jgi:hypothetical protein
LDEGVGLGAVVECRCLGWTVAVAVAGSDAPADGAGGAYAVIDLGMKRVAGALAIQFEIRMPNPPADRATALCEQDAHSRSRCVIAGDPPAR